MPLVLRGARERLSPILMTTLAIGLGLVPALILGDVPGLEIMRPMAIVVLGGLVTLTLLNLFIVPAIYLGLGVRAAQDAKMFPAQFPSSQKLRDGDCGRHIGRSRSERRWGMNQSASHQ